MFQEIEKVVYINLEERTDRRAEIEKQLSIFHHEKIVRFNAIKHQNGAIGCSMSHIAVVEMAIQNNWKNVLIVEDDMIWNQFNIAYPIYQKLISKPYDVVCLGGACVDYDRQTYKAIYVSTTTAYLVNNHYYQTLLANFKEGVEQFIKHEDKHSLYALDRNLMKLMPKDNWFVIQPALCVQKPGYSNIENKFVNYNPQFGVW
jgi:glycosyl transferase family 25